MDKKKDKAVQAKEMMELTLDQMSMVSGGTGADSELREMVKKIRMEQAALTEMYDGYSAAYLISHPVQTTAEPVAVAEAVKTPESVKNAVLLQAGQEMLATANQRTSEVLSLLQ